MNKIINIIGVIITPVFILSIICLYNCEQLIQRQRQIIKDLKSNYYKLNEYEEAISCKKWDDYESIVIGEGLTIDTLEGRMKADIGDYIIKGVNGEFYPCKPNIFAKTYEEVIE